MFMLAIPFSFANKQDLPNAMPVEQIFERLHPKLPFPSHWAVFPLCAIGPKEELLVQLKPGFDWLHDMVNKPIQSVATEKKTVTDEKDRQTTTKKDDTGPRSPAVLKQKFEGWIAKLDSDSSPEEFLRQFHELQLPSWDHYTHIRIAFVILTTYGRQKGEIELLIFRFMH